MSHESAGLDRARPRSSDVDRTFIARLCARLTRRTGCAEEAADIVQDSFLRLAQRSNTSIDNPEGYMWRIARNLAVDRRRRSQTFPCVPLEDDVPSVMPAPDRVVVGRQSLEEVMRIVDNLPQRCREVFVLRKIDGLEQEEIATRLGISQNMVQKHLRKALADIAAALGEGH